MTKYFLLLFLALAVCAEAAELPEMVINPDVSFVTGEVPGLEDIAKELEYKGDSTPRIFLCDLNGDQSDDIVVQSNESLCWGGNCLYLLVDGKSRDRLGYFFGESLFVLKKKKGQSFPDIQTYIARPSGSAVLTTSSYSIGIYTSISEVEVPTERIERVIEEVRIAKSKDIEKVR